MNNLVILLSLFIYGVFYAAISYSFNIPIGAMNNLITNGMVSQTTIDYFDLMLDMWKASPFFVIIGLVLWSFERSKGTMLPAQLFFEYMFMMMAGLVISAYLVYSMGMSMDLLTGALDNSILTDVSEIWDTSSVRNLCISVFYYVLMMPGLLTSLLFIFHPVIEQRENTFFTMDEDEEPDFSSDVEMALKQF